MVQVGFKIEDDVKDLSDRIYEEIKAEKGESYTKGRFYEDMLNAYANPKTKEIPSEEDKRKISDLISENEILDSENKRNIHVFGEYLMHLSQILGIEFKDNDEAKGAIENEIKATQQRAMAVPSEVKVEVQRQLAENEIQFPIPDLHLKILNLLKERLSALYGVQVTGKDIFLDMLLRYNVEQWNEWFYPFVIKSSEFKELFGKSQKELQLWLKKKDLETAH